MHAVGIETQCDPNLEILHWATAMHAHKHIYSRPFEYTGPRPWHVYNPFTSCTCALNNPVKVLLREEVLYCPCLISMAGSSNLIDSSASMETVASEISTVLRLFSIYMTHWLLLFQRKVLNERLQDKETSMPSLSQLMYDI